MNRLFRVASAFIGAFAAGLVGLLFTDSAAGSWYAGLSKPPLMPPDVVFPVVWTILYILMALACAAVWVRQKQDAHTEGWVRFYFIQLLANAGWTIFFFGFHMITIAFIDVLVLFFMVMALSASAWTIDRRVTYIMLPYLAWVFFAAYITAGIWVLN